MLTSRFHKSTFARISPPMSIGESRAGPRTDNHQQSKCSKIVSRTVCVAPTVSTTPAAGQRLHQTVCKQTNLRISMWGYVCDCNRTMMLSSSGQRETERVEFNLLITLATIRSYIQANKERERVVNPAGPPRSSMSRRGDANCQIGWRGERARVHLSSCGHHITTARHW